MHILFLKSYSELLGANKILILTITRRAISKKMMLEQQEKCVSVSSEGDK